MKKNGSEEERGILTSSLLHPMTWIDRFLATVSVTLGRMRSTLILLLFVGGLRTAPVDAQCAVGLNLLENGDFEGAEGESVVAAGWTGMSTPDLNDVNGPLNTTTGYYWTEQPGASANGGTWQNICCAAEGVSQVVETTEGAIYQLCYEYTAQGIVSESYTYADPGCIQVLINSVLALTTPLDTTPYTWETACVSFLASGSTTDVQFITCGGDQVYMAIDGACLREDPSSSVDAIDRVTPRIAPNPASGSCRITCGKPFDRIEAVDARGGRHLLPAVQGQVDLSRLASGIWTVRSWASQGPVSRPVRMVVSPL